MARQYDYEDAHDERMEPNADLDETHGGMPPPDWARTLVHTGQKTMPSGDPTVWGGNITTIIDDEPVLGNTPRVISSAQIIMAQARDRYARGWSIQGVLWLPSGMWSVPSPDPNPPAYLETFPITPTTPSLTVWLSVRMGVERMDQQHLILLQAGDLLTQNYGLCSNQNSFNGGPYGALIPDPTDPGSAQGLPFACMGALVGNSINVQAIYVRGPNVGAEVCGRARITAIVTPYAAGQGI